MRHVSFFTGIGGFDRGLELAGIATVAQCEVDPFCNARLAEHFPGTPNLGDVTTLAPEDIPDADVWTAGTPCQDLSVAGARAGLAGSRSALALTFLDLVAARLPRWVVIENVPGLLDSNGGRDLWALVDRLAGLGFGWAYRVVDAQGFGIPQRRRRVYIVAAHGPDGTRRAGTVLALDGAGPGDRGPVGAEGAPSGSVSAVRAARGRGSAPDPDGVGAATGLPGRLDVWRKLHRAVDAQDPETWARALVSNTLNAFDIGTRDTHLVTGTVRLRDRPSPPDAPRYRTLGNAVPVPVARWLGERLLAADA